MPAGIAVLLLSSGTSLPEPIEQSGHAIISPLFSVRDNITAAVVTLYGSLETKDALLYENERLQAELTSLRRAGFMVEALTRENERLKTLAGYVHAEEVIIPASVIHAAHYAPFGSFVIDAGALQGLREGMLVEVPEGSAVGAVVSVRAQSAIVTLFSAAGMRTDAYLIGDASVPVAVVGLGADTMRIQLSRADDVQNGDMVVLPGAPVAPLGRVVHVDVAEEDAYSIAYVSPAVSHTSLRDVFVNPARMWKIAEQEIVVPVLPTSTTTSATTSTLYEAE